MGADQTRQGMERQMSLPEESSDDRSRTRDRTRNWEAVAFESAELSYEPPRPYSGSETVGYPGVTSAAEPTNLANCSCLPQLQSDPRSRSPNPMPTGFQPSIIGKSSDHRLHSKPAADYISLATSHSLGYLCGRSSNDRSGIVTDWRSCRFESAPDLHKGFVRRAGM
jgi:hypothetical protein